MNTHKTLIVMGRSGSGKGTQINLLKNYYVSHNSEQDIFHFEPGNIFRGLVKSGQFAGQKIKEATSLGKLVPDFITNGIFTSELVQNIRGDEQLLIFDGYPRSLSQADMLDQVLKYFGREDAVVIHVNVSEEEVRNRLLARGRHDDVDMNALNTRIEFYNNSVLPVVDYYRDHSDYTLIEVDGEGDVEEIHQKIISLSAEK